MARVYRPVVLYTRRRARYPCGMSKQQQSQSIWHVDLVELFRDWLNQLSAFMMTALMFFALSLPVVISALVLWYMM